MFGSQALAFHFAELNYPIILPTERRAVRALSAPSPALPARPVPRGQVLIPFPLFAEHARWHPRSARQISRLVPATAPLPDASSIRVRCTPGSNRLIDVTPLAAPAGQNVTIRKRVDLPLGDPECSRGPPVAPKQRGRVLLSFESPCSFGCPVIIFDNLPSGLRRCLYSVFIELPGFLPFLPEIGH